MSADTEHASAINGPGDAWGGLNLRLVAALVASGAVGIGGDRLLSALLADAPIVGLLGALAAAALTGIAIAGTAVAALVRSRADLAARYEVALADSLTDPLTGLGNHRAFHEELERQAAAAERYEAPLSLVLIDLDQFKAVNDASGHAGGDRTLADFGRLLDVSVRRPDRSFRVGGDEFALLLPHTDADGAHVVTRRLLASALQPVATGQGAPAAVSFSAGISALPSLAGSRSQLYSQADSALYAAKRAGRTDVTVFAPGAAAPIESSSSSGAAVVDVIARGLLRPVYQPIVALASEEVLGVEGLTRTVEPAPFADPGSLFAAAEAGGQVAALDLTCIEMMVAGAGRLPSDQFLSVNLSPRTLEAPEFTSAGLLGILARHGFAPERLVIELTETQALGDLERIRMRLANLRRAGIRLAADDLGAGYAGLRLLSELSFDILKVDLGLVRRSGSEGPSAELIRSVVEFAHRTGALVVAEGVEDADQLPFLRELGVQAGQGYHWGRPGPLLVTDASSTPVPADGLTSWRKSIGLPAPASAPH